MYEAKLVDSFDRKCQFSHVKARDVLGEDLVFDEHCHKISTGQKLHQHVEESAVLKGSVQLDHPRTVRLGKNVTLRADVRQLILLVLYTL